jgi:hypothetical protein
VEMSERTVEAWRLLTTGAQEMREALRRAARWSQREPW